MKPDVLKQTEEIMKEREKELMAEHANAPIILQQPGKPPITLTNAQAVEIMKSQIMDIAAKTQRIQELEKQVQQYQQTIASLMQNQPQLQCKSEPVFKLTDL
jgi:ABC-type hemin transport system substrate-binding protein